MVVSYVRATICSILALMLFGVALSGCARREADADLANASGASGTPGEGTAAAAPAVQTGLTDEQLLELRQALVRFEDGFEASLARAGRAARSVATTRAQREAANYVQLRLGEMIDQQAVLEDPIEALINVWTTLLKWEALLKSPANPHGRVDSIDELSNNSLAAIEAMALQYLGGESTPQAEAIAREQAAAHPLAADYQTSRPVTGFRLADVGTSVGGASRRALDLGMGIGRGALGAVGAVGSTAVGAVETVGTGAVGVVGMGVGSVTDLPSIGRRAVEVVSEIPENVRLQTEILLEHDAITTTVLSMERVTYATERVSKVIESLPEEIRKTIVETAEAQGPIQGTISEARQTIDSVTATVEEGTNLTTAATGLMQEVSTTTREARELLEVLERMQAVAAEAARQAPPEPPPHPDAPPFDIREYRHTVDSLTGTIAELRSLLNDTRGLLESEDVGRGLAKAGEEVVVRTERLLIIALIGAGGLLTLFFALFVTARILLHRYARREAAPKSLPTQEPPAS